MTGRENVVRAIFQLIVLGALATPAGAQSLEVFGYAGVLGEWELTASVTGKRQQRRILRAADDDARRHLHGRWPGRKERRNPFADIATIVANVGDIIG